MIQAADALACGHLVAFPTETVYGLGADGLSSEAVQRIFQVKARPADHPVILHVGSIAAAQALAKDWPRQAQRLAERFWPGPLTLILKRSSHVPDIVTGGQDTVGIRLPAHPVALAILSEFSQRGSGVIAAPSANRFGGVSPTRAADVVASIGDRLTVNDLVIDGGACGVGLESTIVDLSDPDRAGIRLLRPGGIDRLSLERVLGRPFNAISGSQAPRVSGALESHYAPTAKALRVDAQEFVRIAQQHRPQYATSDVLCLVMQARIPEGLGLQCHQMPLDPAAYGHDLYAVLNDADQRSIKLLLIESPPQTVEWEAVNDRLKRATARQ